VFLISIILARSYQYTTDGMYKLSIIDEDVYGCAYIVDSSYLWHARLGHLNFKYLKFVKKWYNFI